MKVIKTSEKHYYMFNNNNKKIRISKKDYDDIIKSNKSKKSNKSNKSNKSKKIKGGFRDIEKRLKINKKVYNHLEKNRIIDSNEIIKNLVLNQVGDIANVQSIKSFYFYSHLFNKYPDISPIYIPDEIANEIMLKKRINPPLFKNFFEIHVVVDNNYNIVENNIKTFANNKSINFRLGDGAQIIDDDILNEDNIFRGFLDILYYSLNVKLTNIWSNTMGLFKSYNKFIIIPVQFSFLEGSGHQSIILFDIYNHFIYPFDPNNIDNDSLIYKIAEDIKELFELEHYTLISSNKICGDVEMTQSAINSNIWKYKCPLTEYRCELGTGYCVQTTFFYLTFIMKNYDYINEKTNLLSEFLQILTLSDKDTTKMTNNEFSNYLNNSDIDTNSNINDIINVYHIYQYYEIKNWLYYNGINPNTINSRID
jgi:hypothetical protein